MQLLASRQDGAAEALELALVPLVKGAGLKDYSKYKKAELVTLLKASGIAAPPLQVKKLSRAQLETIASAVLATRAMG